MNPINFYKFSSSPPARSQLHNLPITFSLWCFAPDYTFISASKSYKNYKYKLLGAAERVSQIYL